jgi:hypothetical protein
VNGVKRIQAGAAVADGLKDANGEVGEVFRFHGDTDAVSLARRELGAPYHGCG